MSGLFSKEARQLWSFFFETTNFCCSRLRNRMGMFVIDADLGRTHYLTRSLLSVFVIGQPVMVTRVHSRTDKFKMHKF